MLRRWTSCTYSHHLESRKLDLDQRQAAEIFGGGVNAFSRYENGRTKSPLALVQLRWVLDRHPEPLDEAGMGHRKRSGAK